MISTNNILKWGKNFRLNRKFTIFLFCVVIATIFWLLNALSKSYVVAITVPIQYNNIPDGKMIVNSPPDHIQVRVEGDGFNLLSIDKDVQDPLIINTSSYPIYVKSGQEKISINTRNLNKELSNDLGRIVSILGASHDSIQLVLEDVAQKFVPVKLEVNIQPANHHALKPIIVEPDSIMIYGPDHLLEEIDQVATAQKEILDLKERISFDLPLALSSGKLRVEPQYIHVEAEAEQLTEGEMSIAIKVENVPDSVAVSVYPSNVKVKYAAGLSVFDQINIHNFSAVVDYKDIAKDSPIKLHVSIESAATNVEVIDFEPTRVEYIIRRK